MAVTRHEAHIMGWLLAHGASTCSAWPGFGFYRKRKGEEEKEREERKAKPLGGGAHQNPSACETEAGGF